MQNVILMTKDPSLKKELLNALPKGFKLRTNLHDEKCDFLFFDMDTLRPGLIKELSEKVFVITVTKQMLTGHAMEAVIYGAYETIQRPLETDVVFQILEELRHLKEELNGAIDISRENLPLTPTCAVVGSSPLIMNVCKKVAQLAKVDVPVLITGATGTGKELIAESITQFSSRFGKPFVVINCAAVPEALLESELFGFEKGAFTGAVSAKEGMLKIADGGCVFFDEIGEMPLPLQAKLLRFLQTHSFYPLGSTKEITVNVRVISATNRNLSRMVREGKFREDLYHRLRVSTIHVPPLQERRSDILPLLNFFIYRHRHIVERPIKGFTKNFLKRLLSYDWPGNIRELENTVRSAIAVCKTPYLTTHELKELGSHSIKRVEQSSSEDIASAITSFLKEAVERGEKNIHDKVQSEVEKTIFNYILSYTKENQSEAARLLGISRLTLRKKLGISK